MGTQGVTAVIAGSAPGPGLHYILPYLTRGELVICADGGLQRVREIGLEPDWYVGDSDSGGIAPEGLPHWLLPSEKALTDLEMGVEVAIAQGADTILLCGCTGGRADHHLINILLLEQIAQRGKRGLLLDAVNEVRYLTPGRYQLENTPAYHYFSLIPADREIQGLTLRNCKYELPETDVPRGSSLTVSNEFLPGQPAEISFTGGCVFLTRSVPEFDATKQNT